MENLKRHCKNSWISNSVVKFHFKKKNDLSGCYIILQNMQPLFYQTKIVPDASWKRETLILASEVRARRAVYPQAAFVNVRAWNSWIALPDMVQRKNDMLTQYSTLYSG